MTLVKLPKYTDFSVLTTPMIDEFVDKIMVYAPDRSSGERTQEVDVYLKFVGKFDVPLPDDGWKPCICVQSISRSLVCKYFRAAVLPLDRELETALLYKKESKHCCQCGALFHAQKNEIHKNNA